MTPTDRPAATFPRKVAALVLLSGYVVIRMLADPVFWRQVSEYFSYAFEIGFVVAAYRTFRDRIVLYGAPTRADAIAFALSFAAGLVAYGGAPLFGAVVPFRFDSIETLFLLLILAPLLEEAIFRMALWESIAAWTRSRAIVILATTVLFVGGHLAAYFYVSAEYRSFILYQSAYVALLGIATGYRRLRGRALSAPILVHFGFNLGFAVGYFVMGR